MYFMSTILLKDNINWVRVPQFQINYIRDTTHRSHKNTVELCCEVYYMWWVNKEFELQEWKDIISSNKKMLVVIISVSKNNP